MFHFRGRYGPQKRQAFVECIEAFQSLYGSQLKWVFDDESGRWHTLWDSKQRPLREEIGPLHEDDSINRHMAPARLSKPLPGASFLSTERGWMERETSVLQFHVPRALTFAPESRPTWLELIRRRQKRSPFHGRAGLNSISTDEEVDGDMDKFDLAKCCLALYVSHSVIDSAQAHATSKASIGRRSSLID